MPEIRKLSEVDRDAVEEVLRTHADTSMFIRSNIRQQGFAFEGLPLQGEYFGAFVNGALVDVVGHVWNGALLLQTPNLNADLVTYATRATERIVTGLIGPWPQVELAARVLEIKPENAKLNSCEDFFVNDLADFAYSVPDGLDTGLAEHREFPILASWTQAFNEALIGRTLTNEQALDAVERHAPHLFVVRREGLVVSQALYNAETADCVQIGGVYTPPGERTNGYARVAVAASLLAAKGRGVDRAVLFTQKDNTGARKAYEALGFRRVGDFGLVVFR